MPKTAAQAGHLGRHGRRPVRPLLPPGRATPSTTTTINALDVNSDAIAFAVLTYAYSTESVNGVPGKKVPGNFTIPAPAGPEGTSAGGGSAENPGD